MIKWKKVGSGYDIAYEAFNDEGLKVGTVAKGGNKWYPWTRYLNSKLYPDVPKHQLMGDHSTMASAKESVEIYARKAGLLNVAMLPCCHVAT